MENCRNTNFNSIIYSNSIVKFNSISYYEKQRTSSYQHQKKMLINIEENSTRRFERDHSSALIRRVVSLAAGEGLTFPVCK